MPPTFRFGRFELRPNERQLLLDGQAAAVGARAFDVLCALVENRDRLITKQELLDLVWPGLVVEENNLQVQISSLRRILGPDVIATVAGHGYRFTARLEDATTEALPRIMPAKHNLPQQITSFIGRDAELAEVRALLTDARLVTLVGAGGIGKTRHALHVARDLTTSYADGVWFIDLAPIVDPELVPLAAASTLGIDIDNTQAPTTALGRRLKTLNLLLVLDNCEHLIGAAASVAGAILTSAANVRVLATSREPLAIAGEHVFRLPSLTIPLDESNGAQEALAATAVQLFVARARALDARFAIDDRNAKSIASICRRLDGIPLAIEMAAARSPTIGPRELEQMLDDRFRVLSCGHRHAVPRQQTLRAAFDWSYDLLSERQRTLLNRLAVFRGGFTLQAACAVGSDEATDDIAVVDLLAHLVSCSLVVAEPSAGMRYHLLETIRAYAIDKLFQAGETERVARRHARYFCERFQPAYGDWLRLGDAEWEAIYLPDRDNVRAALDWAITAGGDSEVGIAVAAASGRIWLETRYRKEGRQRLESAIASISERTPQQRQAELWYSLGLLFDPLMLSGLAAMERAADWYRAFGDPLGLGSSLVQLSKYLAHVGRADEATQLLAEARPLLEQAAFPKCVATYHWTSGYVKVCSGDLPGARGHFEDALSLYRVAAAEQGISTTLNASADVAWALGDLDTALIRLRECVTLARNSPLADQSRLALPLANLTGISVERGDLDEALCVAREALPMLKDAGAVWTCVDHLALRAALTGNLESAARIAGFADAGFMANEARRNPNEARARERLERLLSEKLTPEVLKRLLVAGSKMSDDECCRAALED